MVSISGKFENCQLEIEIKGEHDRERDSNLYDVTIKPAGGVQEATVLPDGTLKFKMRGDWEAGQFASMLKWATQWNKLRETFCELKQSCQGLW